jgi:hypothetical protein
MSKQTINIGASPNDGTGTPLRTSFDYTNQNFTEIYTALGGGVALPGATTQVIFNDGGTNLAGDAGLVYNKTTDALTVAGLVTAGSATITGDLTVRTTGLILNTSGLGVGITPTSFGAGYGTIQVSGATGAGIRMGSPTNPSFIYSDASFLNINTSTNIPHRFFVNNLLQYTIEQLGVFTWADGAGGTRMTLNSTGLGIGASPSTLLYVKKSQNADTTLVVNNENSGAAATARLDLQSNANNYLTLQSFGQSYSGNVCGIAAAKLNTVLDNALTANSSGLLIGTVSTNPLYFVTANAVKMTLDSSGNLLVGQTTVAGANIDSFIYNKSGSYAVVSHVNGTGSGTAYLQFLYNNTSVGTITQNGTTGVLYNITSDYRLKESVKPLNGGLARVNALKPSVYNWKSDGSTGEGFLAHELAEVVPFAVSGEKDAVNADGSIKSQGIDMSRIVPILVAAIQELTAEVNALKNA